MQKKITLALLYLGIALLIYFYGEYVLIWLEEASPEWVLLTMLIATLMALFPIIPYPIIGGIIGAAYGSGLGAFVTWFGSSLASILMFLFIRYGYQDWGNQILHQKYTSLAKVTSLFERNAFLALLFTRLIPVIPSIIVNVYAALSRVSFLTYAIASTLGKIPAMFLFALLGNQLVSNPKNMLITVSVYSLFILITLFFYQMWKRTKNN